MLLSFYRSSIYQPLVCKSSLLPRVLMLIPTMGSPRFSETRARYRWAAIYTRKKAAPASAVLHQAFGEHSVYRPVKGFETLVNVRFGMHAGEDAAAARHQVHTPHLYSLTEAVLYRCRNVFQRIGIAPGDGPRPKVNVEGRRLPVDTGGNLLPVDDVAQALAQALGHAVGLGLHRAGSDDAQGRIPRGRTVGVGVKRAAVRDALEAVMLGITGL